MSRLWFMENFPAAIESGQNLFAFCKHHGAVLPCELVDLVYGEENKTSPRLKNS